MNQLINLIGRFIDWKISNRNFRFIGKWNCKTSLNGPYLLRSCDLQLLSSCVTLCCVVLLNPRSGLLTKISGAPISSTVWGTPFEPQGLSLTQFESPTVRVTNSSRHTVASSLGPLGDLRWKFDEFEIADKQAEVRVGNPERFWAPTSADHR